MLALAAVVTLPGRHGQRPLNAALLGGAGAFLLFFGLRGALHAPAAGAVHGAWVPGVAAIVGGVLLALFGLVAAGWGTAFLLASLFACGGYFLAQHFHLWWHPIALLFFGVGLFGGMVNHRGLSIVMPPIFAGLFVALGAAICWAPHWRGAKLWQLNDVDWVLGAWGVLSFVLLGLALERNYRAKVRLAARTKRMDDEKLQKELASRQAKYNRAIDQANGGVKH